MGAPIAFVVAALLADNLMKFAAVRIVSCGWAGWVWLSLEYLDFGDNMAGVPRKNILMAEIDR